MNSLFDLSGKVALVTGGNGGIGFGMAEGLARHGARVAIWGRDEEKNEQAIARLSRWGNAVRAARVDVADEAAVREGVEDIVGAWGRLDIAIANAGILTGLKPLVEITEDDLQRIEAVNVHGVLFTLREAARSMIDRFRSGGGGGALVGVSSIASIHGAARNTHYGATKGSVVSMCRAMAVELAPYRITVNCVCPGWVRTEMTAGAQASQAFSSYVTGRTPAGSWGNAEDFSAVAVYLGSDASRFHTGDTLVIDGGYTIA